LLELAPIRFNAIAPGYTDTPMWDHIFPENGAQALRDVTKKHLIPRLVTADDVAQAVSWGMSTHCRPKQSPQSSRALRIDANALTPQVESGPETIADLVAHYRLKELNEDSHSQKAFPTRAAYQSYLENWVLPRWGGLKLDQIKPVAVEEWLRGIKRAKATRAKIRNLMSALFSHAMRYEWTDQNPIKLVRQSAKRERIPDVLELAELQLLLTKLDTRERTLVLLAAATGLRVSELLGIRWADVDFDTLELRVTRSIWHQKIGIAKQKPRPSRFHSTATWRRTCFSGERRVPIRHKRIGSSPVRP